MTYPRPVPTIGDQTSAAYRAAEPDAWRLPETIEPLETVVTLRRDIRRYRPDAVPEELIEAVLTAGHRAPSVGHSQPWRFIVVRSPETRQRAAVMADQARIKQAAQMDPDSARGLLDLQLEGIREAPLGVVVACDRRTAAAGVLGRATYPDADLWGCACAIQNMWLTARAHGLGMGWVTLFEPDELADMLGLPEGVETLGWLCLGWPDERPPEPGLQRQGWSRKLPLEAVVMSERWSDQTAAPQSHLAADVGWANAGSDRFDSSLRSSLDEGDDERPLLAPAQDEVVHARDRADQLLTAPGSLGLLDQMLDRITALPVPLTGGALVLAAADHAVCAHGVSAFEQHVTADVWRATLAGESMGAVAAREAGLGVLPVDAGVGVLRGDLLTTDAVSEADFDTLWQLGLDHGRDAATHGGLVALGEVGVGNTTAASLLAARLLGLGADAVVGRGTSSDTAMMERKRRVIEQALERVDDNDPLTVLRRLGGAELIVLAAATIGAAQAGAAVVLDGLATSVAALAAVRQEPAIQAHLVAGQRSRERAHAAVLAALGLEPLLDLRIRSGEGVGACLASGLLLDGLAVRRDVARSSEKN